MAPWPADRFDASVFSEIAPLVQERVAMLSEIPPMIDFLFLEDAPTDPDASAKVITNDPRAPEILRAAIDAYETAPFDAASLHEVTLAMGDAMDLKLRKTQAPIRVAVTGRSVGPPLFESLSLLGRDEVRRRLGVALDRATG
ncbi:MAG: hypothetical protein WCI12_11260 [Actinomycetes bacterium]